ncbi:CpaD family pilus assembly lipoprotein [Candidimonas sp. SYP-B2681]|uniref:CpaD family pilus assembly lipoprotein n=1 Tax=Candidimonas sp. SYP-B2681 TaxID=2497686 RepID=UPI001F287FDA|nr:CpaD family pilus assembly lipoprotein [Candidimonas sp. SYP-B2681]
MNTHALPLPLMALVLVLTLAGCTFPRKDISGIPGPEIIKVTQDDSGFRALAPDCKPLLQPSQLNKSGDRRQAIAFGCATYTNLAEQIARPQDLTHPGRYAGQSPDTAGAAVKRHRDNTVTPLRGTRATDVGAKD